MSVPFASCQKNTATISKLKSNTYPILYHLYMVLAFNNQFKAPILAGTKKHSIRKDEQRKWRTGRSIHMATGVRTKNYDCFKKSTCTGTQRIFMSYDWMLHISIDDRELYPQEKETLAINDGFENFKAFEDYWYPEVMKGKHQSYSGKIVHWTDFRYTRQ